MIKPRNYDTNYNCSRICPTNYFKLWCSTFRWVVGGFTVCLAISFFIIAGVRCAKKVKVYDGPRYELMVDGETVGVIRPEGYTCRSLRTPGVLLVLFGILLIAGGILIMLLANDYVVTLCTVESLE